MMTGKNDSNSPPTTSRVRNFEPRTPSRRSAKSFRRLRARTNVRATNSKKINAERAAKDKRGKRCWLVSGLRNGRSKDDWERRIPKSRRIPIASKMITFLRLVVPWLRVGLGGDTL